MFGNLKYLGFGVAIFAAASAFGLAKGRKATVAGGDAAAMAQPGNLTARAGRDEVVLVKAEDPAMTTAREKARATLDTFLAAYAAPVAGSRAYSVKVKVSDGKAVEYFWVKKLRREGDGFAGNIDNEPETVHSVKNGQEIRFARAEVTDWMYLDNGKMRGNFTACALLGRETPAEREKFRKAYGLDCAG